MRTLFALMLTERRKNIYETKSHPPPRLAKSLNSGFFLVGIRNGGKSSEEIICRHATAEKQV